MRRPATISWNTCSNNSGRPKVNKMFCHTCCVGCEVVCEKCPLVHKCHFSMVPNIRVPLYTLGWMTCDWLPDMVCSLCSVIVEWLVKRGKSFVCFASIFSSPMFPVELLLLTPGLSLA